MNDLQVSVEKLTDEKLMRKACESTFLGKSKATLLDLYKAEHSPVRTQLFWVTLTNVKLFVSTHLLRHHVGVIPFQLTCRDDRKGGNPGMVKMCSEIAEKLRMHAGMLENGEPGAFGAMHECANNVEWLADNADRNTKVNLSLLVNAQAFIDMAKLRLCLQAHVEPRQVFDLIKQEIAKIDPSLASMMVRKCVYRGGLCGEMRCCGFNNTPAFKIELAKYASCFSDKQLGISESHVKSQENAN